MSEISIEEMRQQMIEKLAALDKQRREEAEKSSKEREERRFLEEAERAERIRLEKAKQAEFKRKREEEQAEREKAAQAQTAARLELERKQNEQETLNEKLREQYEYIQNEIAKAEFVEEQHRKRMETEQYKPEDHEEMPQINVENPAAPVNTIKPGEAVEGTDGDTPSTPLMSQHLKQILRQASRTY